MILFPPDHPLVLDGTYDQEGWKPGERARWERAELRKRAEQARCRHRFNEWGFCPDCLLTRAVCACRFEADSVSRNLVAHRVRKERT
jgi:hypothetical protein